MVLGHVHKLEPQHEVLVSYKAMHHSLGSVSLLGGEERQFNVSLKDFLAVRGKGATIQMVIENSESVKE